MTLRMFVVLAWLGLVVWVCPRPAVGEELAIPPGHSGFAQLEAFGSFLNDALDQSNVDLGFGFSCRFGWRHEGWGAYLEIQRSYWVTTDLVMGVNPGVLNIGMGMDHLFLNKRVRTSVVVGSSTLLFDAVFHDKGKTGYYVEFRPAGLRFPITHWLLFELTPLAVTLMTPVPGDPGIKNLEYRSVLAFEVGI